jgi:antitoxin component YwqK of YwqJK toxin-antitoxin module
MKKINLYLLLALLFVLSCEKTSEEQIYVVNEEFVITNLEIDKNELILNGNEGNWYYKSQPFNGYKVSYNSNGFLEQKVGFYNGKKEGVAKIWFSDGEIKVESHYHQNKLVGSYKAWWPNGVLASESFYENGELHGVEKRWYDSGQLAKKMHYNKGNEAGMQQAWLKNGKMYVNYEAKNGRIFGMRKANLCYELKNEVVIKEIEK